MAGRFKKALLEKGDMSGMSQKSGHMRPTKSGAGMTQLGVEEHRRRNKGSKLQTAVTTPPSELKPGSKPAKRRKSFCARSRGWTGERGKAARRRWNCSTDVNPNALQRMAEMIISELYSGTIPKRSKAARDVSNKVGMDRIVRAEPSTATKIRKGAAEFGKSFDAIAAEAKGKKPYQGNEVFKMTPDEYARNKAKRTGR